MSNLTIEALASFFPEYPEWDFSKLLAFTQLIREWNMKVNLISRKDIDNLEAHHLAPSLAVAKCVRFNPKATVLDVGTGGGFPGLPLAICFPETQFTLVDSIGKKIRIVQAIAESLGLTNVRAKHLRVEEENAKFDFVLGRAVTALKHFLPMVQKNIRPGKAHALKNGILYLKGGDVKEELAELKTHAVVYPLADFFNHQLCQDKTLVHCPYTSF